MPKYPGRIISATPPTVSLSGASGVWTLEEALQYQQAGTWPVAVGPVVADPNFNQTVLLLHGDGTNGAQNNTFLDSSTNNFTITRNGNTTQGTFSPFSVGAGEWSNYFDGTGDYFSIASATALNLSTGAFTLEGWIYPSANVVHLFSRRSAATARGLILAYGNVTNNKFSFLAGDTSTGAWEVNITSTDTFAFNAWYHVAITRDSSNNFTLWVNGTSQATTNSNVTIADDASNLLIGGIDNTGSMNGYLSNLRLVKGRAVYTSAFTPSTTPLGATSGGQDPPQGTETGLLTCQSNRFVDNSTNAFAITRNGDVRVTPFSPFAPSAAYDPAVNGGSGYFDGTGDYLTAADNAAFTLGSSDFTIEFWMYNGTSGVRQFIAGQIANTGLNATTSFAALKTSTNKLNCRVCASTTSYDATSTNDLPLNAWTHIAFVRDGNTIRQYINGVEDGTASVTGVTVNDSANTLSIGRLGELNLDYFAGYIAGFRQVVGTCLYPGGTAFTPPTSPPTAVSGTQYLCNFTNAGIIDNTGKNNLETVGNAQIDTTTKKYGTGSMEFDGTGDWLLMPNNPDQQLGTGNFTIEFWVYLASGDTGSNRGLVAKGGASTGWLVSLNTTEKVVFTYTTSTITSTGSITTNAWNHIAVVREGTGSNQTKIYIGGTNDGTGTVSTAFTQTESMYVGANRTGGDPMKGFIDDLRITKGVARYTSNFTPPVQAFSDF